MAGFSFVVVNKKAVGCNSGFPHVVPWGVQPAA